MSVQTNPAMTVADAAKVDQLCGRILGDIGSVHRRVAVPDAPMPQELADLRKFIREMQDAVRDRYPDAFFR